MATGVFWVGGKMNIGASAHCAYFSSSWLYAEILPVGVANIPG